MVLTPCRIADHATYHSRWNVQPTRGTAGRLGPHHMDGLNLIFADGHAKWQKVFPEDCAAWVPAMPKGVRKVTDPTTLGCNPMNTTGTGTTPTGQWCGSN
jgi:prepilin-type processing-associated H-X9-DG protein